METFVYRPKGVCSREMRFEMDGDIIRNVTIVGGCAGNPQIIFLDEPTTGLDPQSRHSMWSIIKQLNSMGITIFLTTQYLEEAEQLADHIAILDQGRILTEGTPAELKKLLPQGIVEFEFPDSSMLEAAMSCTGGYSTKPKVLNGLAIDNDFVWVEGMTRTNLKVLDHEMELTELNEAGPVITETEIKQLKDKILSLLHPNDFVVLSGNVSAQVRKDIYRELIELVKQQGARVILDADGELFAQGIQAKPYVIKPNKYELATYFGVSQDCSNEEMISLAKTLLNEECRLVVVSMGKQGSIFLSHEGIYQAEALHIQAHSSVGAGDAMVAAIAYALEQDTPMEQLIALAVACSAGAVMTKGTQPAEKAVVEKLMKQVTIKKLEEN